MEPIIEFKDFSFKYAAQKQPTIKNINLTINKGEKILIAGLSGCGKSTLGNCINGLIPFVYEGKIDGSLKIKGKETKNLSIPELSKMVGTVLQDSDGQFVGLSVGEDIAFSLENDCTSLGDMKKRVLETAKKVEMEDFLSVEPSALSGGQKQRVALAGVMVDDVDILLFDEPLANLDPATGKTTIELIDEISKNTGATVIIIEHRIEDVLWRNVDRVILVKDGEIIADKKPDELLSSNMLHDAGVREPLYITACKYAGIEISEDKHPGYIHDFILNEEDKEKLKKWAKENDSKTIITNDPILEIKNLTFSYTGIKNNIDDVSMVVNKGEMLAIVGKNGAGKSTLSKLLMGFEKEDAGQILLEGRDIKDDTIYERGRQIGLVLQNPNQMICSTMIYDEVAFCLRNEGLKEDEIKPRVEEALKICGLYEFRNWPISALSYGQKKRVTIASILVTKPKIIVLDEPTAGQDYRHYTEIMEFLEDLHKNGQTIVMITHDMHLMTEYCTRSVAILNGKKIFDGPCNEILSKQDIVEKAYLKKTSLYDLAVQIDVKPEDFTRSFINYERSHR